MEIELKIVEEHQVASISHEGRLEDMGAMIGELAGWINAKRTPDYPAPFFGILHQPNWKYRQKKFNTKLACPFREIQTADERVKIKIMPKHKVLSAIHKGPYAGLGPVYAEMIQYIIEGGYEMIGRLQGRLTITTPGKVPEKELLTEVMFPVVGLENSENSSNDSNLRGQSEELTEQENPCTISPIGYVRKEGMRASLEIIDKYIPGLKELNNFSHVIVLWWANRIRK